jgi:splicing factor 1
MTDIIAPQLDLQTQPQDTSQNYIQSQSNNQTQEQNPSQPRSQTEPPPVSTPTEERGRTLHRTERKTKWSPETQKTFIPGVPTYIPPQLTTQQMEALLMRIRIEEIGYKIQHNLLDLDLQSREPSPEPVYDAMGKRVNTKEQRAKDKLNRERGELIKKAILCNPGFRPPSDFKPMQTKKYKKIYIPYKQYPDYNFIGLIIGPRGLTQKQMEKETGAKIAIRGKGSVKEGKGKPSQNPGDDDELHVLISADTDEQLNAAAKMIQKLLIPVEEGKNEHKMNQLRKLAEINGTLRENIWGPATQRTWTTPNVYCKHCGEISHPTSDCPLKAKQVNKEQLNDEYANFMASLGLDPSSSTANNQKDKDSVEKSYEEFMAAISEATQSAQQKQQPQQPQQPQQQQPPPSSLPPPPPSQIPPSVGSEYAVPPYAPPAPPPPPPWAQSPPPPPYGLYPPPYASVPPPPAGYFDPAHAPPPPTSPPVAPWQAPPPPWR